ncbi:MAG: hypothetical protein ACR2JY_07705 [Chloroflexota bacterium]
MSRQQHRLHGDPQRFDILADFIADRFGNSIKTVADVAGGQGLLARMLRKRNNYDCEVIDPRGWTLKGVSARQEEFDPTMAPYYDLVVGLHPDEALRAVAQAALMRPVVLVPCCNFWAEQTLGRDELVGVVEQYYHSKQVRFERVTFGFRGPKNIGLVSQPPV